VNEPKLWIIKLHGGSSTGVGFRPSLTLFDCIRASCSKAPRRPESPLPSRVATAALEGGLAGRWRSFGNKEAAPSSATATGGEQWRLPTVGAPVMMAARVHPNNSQNLQVFSSFSIAIWFLASSFSLILCSSGFFQLNPFCYKLFSWGVSVLGLWTWWCLLCSVMLTETQLFRTKPSASCD
jgi:hypothetical protein